MRKPVFGLRIRIGKKNFHLRSDSHGCKLFTRCFSIIALVVISVALMISNNAFSIKDRLIGRVVWNYPVTVAHAGGMIEEYTYTNSKDAILYNYENGQRTFEIDFSVTTDNVLVGQHDWGHVVQEGVVSGAVPTADEFVSKPIYGKFSPMKFEDICLLLEEYPDMWIVTDTKNLDEENVRNDMTLIVETARNLGLEYVLDRIIIQIYTPEMYEVANEVYSFDNWVFTLYQYWDGKLSTFSDIVKFCRKSGIDTITVSNSGYKEELVQMADAHDIKLYVHTVNKLEKAQKYLDEGVWGVYTDSIEPEELRRNE